MDPNIFNVVKEYFLSFNGYNLNLPKNMYQVSKLTGDGGNLDVFLEMVARGALVFVRDSSQTFRLIEVQKASLDLEHIAESGIHFKGKTYEGNHNNFNTDHPHMLYEGVKPHSIRPFEIDEGRVYFIDRGFMPLSKGLSRYYRKADQVQNSYPQQAPVAVNQ